MYAAFKNSLSIQEIFIHEPIFSFKAYRGKNLKQTLSK